MRIRNWRGQASRSATDAELQRRSFPPRQAKTGSRAAQPNVRVCHRQSQRKGGPQKKPRVKTAAALEIVRGTCTFDEVPHGSLRARGWDRRTASCALGSRRGYVCHRETRTIYPTRTLPQSTREAA